MTKNKITIIITMSILLLVFAVYYIFITVDRSDKTLVRLSVFPEDTLVTINGEEVKGSKVYLAPGSYPIQAERDGFAKFATTITVDEDDQVFAVLLRAESDEAKKYVKDNQEAYDKVYGDGQETAAEIGKMFNDRNPIAKHLPYKTFFYTIGYRMDQRDPSGNSIIIEIDAPEGYRQSAIYRIRQLGYDPTDFTINFRDYENPFPL